jgi:hypothetical protein
MPPNFRRQAASDRVKLRLSTFSACITEPISLENSRLASSVPISTSPRYHRYCLPLSSRSLEVESDRAWGIQFYYPGVGRPSAPISRCHDCIYSRHDHEKRRSSDSARQRTQVHQRQDGTESLVQRDSTIQLLRTPRMELHNSPQLMTPDCRVIYAQPPRSASSAERC